MRAAARWPTRRRGASARASLAWALAFYVVGQAALLVWLDEGEPAVRHPEYGYRMARLRERLAEGPGRPLVLVVGSSRTETGVRPQVLPPYRTPDGQAPLIFNFGLSSSGPIEQLLLLHRLLDEGIRPHWVFLEVHPHNFHNPNWKLDHYDNRLERIGWRDLGVMARYCEKPGRLRLRWLAGRLTPAVTYRLPLQSHYAPTLLPPYFQKSQLWSAPDAGGYVRWFDTVTPYQRRVGIHASFVNFVEGLHGMLFISPLIDRVLRDLVELCRREGVGLTLLLSPEGPAYRSWYAPHTAALVNDYLAGLRREYGVAVIDARDWAEEEEFMDSHHLLPDGARRFTERLGREALRPLLEEGVGPAVGDPRTAAQGRRR